MLKTFLNCKLFLEFCFNENFWLLETMLKLVFRHSKFWFVFFFFDSLKNSNYSFEKSTKFYCTITFLMLCIVKYEFVTYQNYCFTF